MSLKELNYEISNTKRIIVNIILNKEKNKFIYLGSSFCKLFTSSYNSPNFVYSGLKGGLFFYLNSEDKSYNFIMFELSDFKIIYQQKLKIESFKFYKKLKKNFYYLEIIDGFIGFYFYNIKDSEEIYKICNELNEKFTNERIEKFKEKKNKEEKDLNLIYINLKNQLKKNINPTKNLTNEKKETLNFNLTKIKILSNNVDYNIYNNKLEFIGYKKDYEKLLEDEKIKKEKINFVESSLKIKEKKDYVNILINHMLNTQIIVNYLQDIKLEFKSYILRNELEKSNNYSSSIKFSVNPIMKASTNKILRRTMVIKSNSKVLENIQNQNRNNSRLFRKQSSNSQNKNNNNNIKNNNGELNKSFEVIEYNTVKTEGNIIRNNYNTIGGFNDDKNDNDNENINNEKQENLNEEKKKENLNKDNIKREIMRQITNVNNEKKINNHLDENEIKQHSKIESQTISFDFRESLTQEKIMNIRSSLQPIFQKKEEKNENNNNNKNFGFQRTFDFSKFENNNPIKKQEENTDFRYLLGKKK